MRSLFLVLALAAAASAQQTWPNLKFKFTIAESQGFFDQPRTVSDAEAEGWSLLSSCGENPNFVGNRYAKVGSADVVLIYDNAGFIAGVQSMVLEEAALDGLYFDFENSPWYVKDDFLDDTVYYNTAYFVDPSIICDAGRTQEEFDAQGTGNAIFFQQGNDPNAADAMFNIPVTQSEMNGVDGWYEHLCFDNMGIHYFTFDYTPDQDCDTTVPFQVVYNLDGDLNGIVVQHIADTTTTSDNWEVVSLIALISIVDSPPTCLRDAVSTPGLTTMHMYVADYHIDC